MRKTEKAERDAAPEKWFALLYEFLQQALKEYSRFWRKPSLAELSPQNFSFASEIQQAGFLLRINIAGSLAVTGR